MKVCIIPARGGSKRIPRKNIRNFCGKPVIAWSINKAIESRLFDKVIVSTDDQDIADISKEYGAEVPFLRPKELSDDFTGTIPVIKHSINWINKNMAEVKYACCIYATAPFIEIKYLIEGYEKLIEANSAYTLSVTTFSYPIRRAIRITESNKIQMIYPENYKSRSQDLEETFHDAGQFYWGKSDAWMQNKDFFKEHSSPVFIPRFKVQDIDTEEDWERAQNMFKILNPRLK